MVPRPEAQQLVGRRAEEFTIGESWTTPGRTIGEGDITTFAGLVGDFTPIHVDAEYAAKSEFGGRIAHGPLTMSVAIGLLTQLGVMGDGVLGLLNLNWDFSGPVRIGDTIRAQVTVAEARLSSRPGAGVVRLSFVVSNQRAERVQFGTMTVLMKTQAQRPVDTAGS
jgi:acyl dehydratase